MGRATDLAPARRDGPSGTPRPSPSADRCDCIRGGRPDHRSERADAHSSPSATFMARTTDLTTILRKTGLVDEQLQWNGGRTTVVQTGDYTDRGADVKKVMDLLMRLERDARSAGGQFIVLAGNHEIMNLIADFRDVTPEICAPFVTKDSAVASKTPGSSTSAWRSRGRRRRLPPGGLRQDQRRVARGASARLPRIPRRAWPQRRVRKDGCARRTSPRSSRARSSCMPV